MQAIATEKFVCSSLAGCAVDLALELYALSFYLQLTVRIRAQRRGSEMKRALGILKLSLILHMKRWKSERGSYLLEATQLISDRELCLLLPIPRLY